MGMLPEQGRSASLVTAVAGFTAVRAVQLSWSLFTEYLMSPTFHGDIADALCNFDSLSGFYQSGLNVSVFAALYSRVLGTRLLYRFTECAVSSTCAYSSSPFLQGAVVYHYLYPTVQEYRFGRCWLTRLLRSLTSWMIPRFLRSAPIDPEEDPDGAFLQSPPAPAQPPSDASTAGRHSSAGAGGSLASSSSRLPAAGRRKDSASSSAGSAASAGFAREEAAFNAMPDLCAAAMRYYLYSYKASPMRTILQAAFIPDVSRCIVELGSWGGVFAEEHAKHTSRWRVLKRFIADQASVATQLTLSYAIRYVGARAGMGLFREPTGGAIFWTEHMLHFSAAFYILLVSVQVGRRVFVALDEKFPATAEDVEEDRKDEEEATEAAARQDAWARMSSENYPSGGGGNSGGGARQGRGSNNDMVNFYAVLGVQEKAGQAEIKKAFRQLALKNHPDRVGRDAQAQTVARERMAVINEAYDTLMDPRKKAQYDTTRRMPAAPEFVERLEKMSAPKLVGLSVGLASVVGFAGYAHFVATFQRVTSSGGGPMSFFTGGC